MAVLLANNNTVQFRIYVPSNDSDADGVDNAQDAFPLDPAASVDTDRDGYPDAWNAGRTRGQHDGPEPGRVPPGRGVLAVAHGSGGACDYGATVPDYVPDQVTQHGDTIYLLSAANRRVYRWSIGAGASSSRTSWASPGLPHCPPTLMTHSNPHQRLYLRL